MLLRGIFVKANNSFNAYRYVVMLFILVGFSCNFDTTLFSVTPTEHVTEWQLGFQAPASPIAEGIIAFHDDLMVFLTLVFFFVVYLLSICMHYFSLENARNLLLMHWYNIDFRTSIENTLTFVRCSFIKQQFSLFLF